jgi:F-type H+-transporting ATPase subunit epsilon
MAEHQESSSGGTLHCVVVTPEETAIDTTARFIAVPLFDGELGIAPGRAALIGRLGYGELRVVDGGDSKRYYLDGGFVQVARDEVTILTGRAVPAEKLDAEVVGEQLRTARDRKANSEETLAIRERLMTQARAQLRMAGQRKPSGH